GLALATLVLAACTPTGAPAQKPQAAPAQPAPESAGQAPALARDVSVRIGHVGAPTSLYEMDAQDYAKRVDQASGGRAKVQTYPNSQPGKQQEMVEQTQLGALEMVISSSEFVSIVPEFGVFDL